ncbi:SGNH/GDSL hydrolase family protein [Luteimonas aestuarii]|nr:SGNH/GDSL hydrolase family protein [Luteimonas aestuarii]
MPARDLPARVPFLPMLLGLLLAACSTAPALQPATDAEARTTTLDPVSDPAWVQDMARFAAEDAANPPPRDAVVFTGSSSVRMWDTLAADFPGVPVLNRGFGGSQVRDSVHYADEVALRYRPRQVLIYAGDNDINAGRTPAQVLSDFQAFVTRLRSEQPLVRIGYLAIKPSPSRIEQLPRQQAANRLVREWTETQDGVDFIDVATPLLDASGRPREDLFIGDRLHLNAAAYALWREVVAPYLQR